MKRVKILYDAVGWAYYNNATQIKRYAPDDWIVDIGPQKYEGLENYDLIFQFAYCYIDNLQKYLASKNYYVPVITSYNSGVGYNPISVLKHVVDVSDGVVINNYGMYNTFGRNPKTTCIPNGVNLDMFKVTNPIEERTATRVLWISSKFHAEKQKGYSMYALPLKAKLEADGIQCDFRLVDSVGGQKMTHPELAKWYNDGTIYVVTAFHEGTPNPALESAACGCTVVATPVGNMPELIIDGYNGYITDWNVEDMYQKVKKAINGYQLLAKNMQTIIAQWDWKDRSQWYYNFFDKILSTTSKHKVFTKSPYPPSPVPSEPTTGQHYEIFAYCSKNYLNAYNFSISSWTEKENVDKVTIYTDWDYNSRNPKIEIVKLFNEENCNWVVGCERRLDAIKHFSEKYKNSGKNIIFMDMDCYLKSDVSEVFDKDFDIAITRLNSTESYTNGTATDGLWFAKMTPGYDEFIKAWLKDAAILRKRQNYDKPRQITYTQYAFTRVAKIKLATSLTCKIYSLDEHIYNSEHSDLNKWLIDVKRYRPKILHFKGGRFNDPRLVYEVMQLYSTVVQQPKIDTTEPPKPQIRKLKRPQASLALWRRTAPVLCNSIIKRGH